MHKLSALLLSGVLLLCASSPALADAYLTNQDSVTRTIFVKCEGDKGTKHTITSGNGVHVTASLLNAGGEVAAALEWAPRASTCTMVKNITSKTACSRGSARTFIVF